MKKGKMFLLILIIILLISCVSKSEVQELDICITALTTDGNINITFKQNNVSRFIHGGTISFYVKGKRYVTPIYSEVTCTN